MKTAHPLLKPSSFAALAILALAPIFAAANDAQFIFDGDAQIYVGDSVATASRDEKGAYLARLKPWEDGVLPLEFSDKISTAERSLILAACREWEDAADVRCQVGRYKGRSLRVGRWFDACWALWGMGTHFVVAKRRMNLAPYCITHHATLLHEFGHAFGLIHEHQRPDRDQFITIHRENVQPSFLGFNFRVNFGEQAAELVTPYDFSSIMHYSRTAFSKNGRDTIVPKPPYAHWLDLIGRAVTISSDDARTLAQIYGPPRSRARANIETGEMAHAFRR